ncbi:MAG: hypothetical protein BWY11_02434 [Firmicutes bacterium ADurb.Bin182]|nr:MAG: hypothetical protein BWY11_02434 [Firmicutes bacterium ADurb.Bin182]
MDSNQIPELDKLYRDVSSYRNSNAYKELLNFVKRFPKLAPYNAMLIYMQYPGCQYAATAYEWERFGRYVNLDARPLVILRTFGPVSFVFDVNDTTGTDLPEDVLNPLKVKGEITEAMFKHLTSNMLNEGVRYSFADQGSGSGGLIRYGGIPEIIYEIKHVNANSINIRTIFEIVLNKNQTQETNYATILHELGHMYCGHCPHPKAKWLPKREFLTRNIIEFEAESVSWLVCERLGIDNPSEKYLNGYLDNNASIPDISVDSIMKAAGKVERLIQTSIQPRKELVIKDNE